MVFTTIKRELSHFQTLGRVAKSLLISASIYEFSFPLTNIFVNAFLLRELQSFEAVAVFNLGIFILLPLSFIANGWLLRRIALKWMFLFGAVGQGITASLVFFLPLDSLATLFLFGCLQGIPFGLYFANRNFLNLMATHDSIRNYYTALEMTISTIAGVITPLVVGWSIAGVEAQGWLSMNELYRILGLVSILLLLLAGLAIFQTEIDQPYVPRIWARGFDKMWWRARWLEIFRGVQSSLELFIIPILVFTFFGQERALGTLQATSALVSTVILYYVGRSSQPHHRIPLLRITIGLLIFIAASFALFNSHLLAFMYVLLLGTFSHLIWIGVHPIVSKVIDLEDGGRPDLNYSYVVDRETFLNVGRIIGVIVFFSLIRIWSQEVALRWILVIAAVLQLGLLKMAESLAHNRK
jgi:MFS transporter, YQGE family, putative transporter